MIDFIKRLFCLHEFVELCQTDPGTLCAGNKTYRMGNIKISICPKCKKVSA